MKKAPTIAKVPLTFQIAYVKMKNYQGITFRPLDLLRRIHI
jgi:hypothetical protein